MTVATLDMIVMRSLLEKGLPIHYYSKYLYHAAAAVRELAKDTLKIVQSANLPVNDYNAVDLPIDFVDELAVALPSGGLLYNVTKQPMINPIRVHDTTTGEFVSQSDSNSATETYFGFIGNWSWYWNVNDWGEPTGRYFGAGGGVNYGYSLVKERRQIQFTGAVTSGSIVLLYVSSGQNPDNATQVEWQAFNAIQAYCDWKTSPNASSHLSPEANTFWNAKRLLRGNLNDMTKTDIINIIRNSYKATVKN
jgi:hypothetical protein